MGFTMTREPDEVHLTDLAVRAIEEGREDKIREIRYYWEVLQKARITGMPLPTEAEQAFFG